MRSEIKVLVCIVFAVGFAYFVKPLWATEPIKIGIYLPLSGQNAFGGQRELEGIQLAHRQEHTLFKRPIELVIKDNQSDKTIATQVVQALVNEENVHAIIGTYDSSLALAGALVAEQAHIPMVGTSCTNPLVTHGKKYVFRVCFVDPFQGTGAATYALKHRKLTKAALLIDKASPYSMGLAAFFKKAFVRMGGSIVAEIDYHSGEQNFSQQITALMAQKPDIVFMPAFFAEGALILQEAHKQHAKFLFMGADAMDNPETLELIGDAAEGFLHTSFPYDPTMKTMNAEAQIFTKMWNVSHPNKPPNVNSALGYNAYMLIIDALKRAESTNPQQLAQALAATKNLRTVLGPLTINTTHDAEMPIGIIEYKDGVRTYIDEVVVY